MQALIDACDARPAARGALCACLDSTAMTRLRRTAGDLRVTAGNTIFSRNDPAEHVYGLRSGSAMLSRRCPDGRRQVLAFLFPGDLFGFAENGRQSCDATALEAVGLCRIPLSAARRDPDLSQRLLHSTRAAVLDALEHLVLLGRMSALERCAWFLAHLWRRKGQPEELFLPMRIPDVADYLGLQPETVSRQFTLLRRRGVISPITPDHFMRILDGAGLASSGSC